MKRGDIVRVTANFECPGQETVPQGAEGRLCMVNEHDKIGTIDLGDSMPVVPLTLLEVVKNDNSENIPWGEPVPAEPLPEEAHESKTGSLRFNKGKLPMHLVPPSAIKAMAAVLEKGMEKYGERNWEKGANYSVPYASLYRHLMEWWEGKDIDDGPKGSGLPHSYHILMNAAMIVYYEQMKEDFDDRPKGM